MSTQPWLSRGNIIPRGAASGQTDSSPTSAQHDQRGHSQARQGNFWTNEIHNSDRGQSRGSDRVRNHWRGRGRGRGEESFLNSHERRRGNSSRWNRRNSPEEGSRRVNTSATSESQDLSGPRAERFSRLKPANLDPLQEIGLPSKGDEKLLSFSVQESYFELIQTRYTSLYGTLPTVGLTQMQLDGAGVDSSPLSNRESLKSAGTQKTSSIATGGSRGIVMGAMRGLREGLYASQRRDAFAVHAFVFIIRASIYSNAGYETYTPALRHILYRLADGRPSDMRARKGTSSKLAAAAAAAATEEEEDSATTNELVDDELLEELATYYILDLTCRRKAYREAFEARQRWLNAPRRHPSDESSTTSITKLGQMTPISASDQLEASSSSPLYPSATHARTMVDFVLRALIHGDWTLFWRACDLSDVYQHRLIEAGKTAVRAHALACLGKTYFTVDEDYVRGCSGGDDIKELIHRKEVTWEVEGNVVIIRRVVKK